MIRRHPVLVLLLPLTMLVLAGVAAVAVTYDHRTWNRIPTGTVIGGMPVGDMPPADATRLLRRRFEQPLRQPITVRAERFETTTSAWDLGYRVDVDRAVAKAMRPSRDGNLFTRLSRRLLNTATPAPAPLRPEWMPGSLDLVLAGAADAVGEAPRDADVDVSTGWVQIVPAKAGRVLDLEASRQALIDTAVAARSSVTLTSTPTAPADTLANVILVRAGENLLHLYREGTIVKSWPVATGSGAYPTPTGVFHVVSKLVNPVWINPNSKWSRNMPARIGPGPRNPLGTRALALDAPGILIHATSDNGSIGYSVSHGCIRMTEADERELFDAVPVGTRVAIVQAAPPKPRGAPVVLPPTPSPIDLTVVEF